MSEQVGTERPGWVSWAVPVALALVLVAGLVVALVAVRTHDARPHAAAGDLFDHPYQEDPLGDVSEVYLPWARLEVAVGTPRAELPELLGTEATVQAPEGGSFVRVDVRLPENYAVPYAAVASPLTGETGLALRADGRDYPLNAPGGFGIGVASGFDQGGTRWVAVDGEPTELEVVVTFDGVSEVVDTSDGSVDAGRFAPFADLPTPQALEAADPVRCGPARRLDDSGLRVDYPRRLPCRVDFTLRTPFVDGLGWAEEGREFLVVQIGPAINGVSVQRGRGDDAEYWDDHERRLTATLGGARSLSQAYTNDLTGGGLALADVDNPQQLVFDVPEADPVGDLAVMFTVAVDRGAPFVTDRATLRFRWVVPGGRLS